MESPIKEHLLEFRSLIKQIREAKQRIATLEKLAGEDIPPGTYGIGKTVFLVSPGQISMREKVIRLED